MGGERPAGKDDDAGARAGTTARQDRYLARRRMLLSTHKKALGRPREKGRNRTTCGAGSRGQRREHSAQSKNEFRPMRFSLER